ncbi:MAG TPA: endonuclease/exonuclease/phosphatase family protein, partial [Rectinemataceae bacterium]|nr:endonuclease/exonuclease/phosphatase family protein [Rectinemataceae bacterium]
MGKGRFRSRAGAVLSVLTVASVALLVALAFARGPVPQSALVQAQEKPAHILPPSVAPAAAPPAAAAPDNSAVVRLATWNVRDCAAWDDVAKTRIPLHDYVAKTIKEAQADIVVLEEIQSDESKGGDIALLSVALAREGWAMPYVAVVNPKGEDDLAIFSRYKIAGSGPVIEPGAG